MKTNDLCAAFVYSALFLFIIGSFMIHVVLGCFVTGAVLMALAHCLIEVEKKKKLNENKNKDGSL